MGIRLRDRVCFENMKKTGISKSLSVIHSSGLTMSTSIKCPRSPSEAYILDKTTSFTNAELRPGTSLQPRSHLRTGNFSSISVISSTPTCGAHTSLPYTPWWQQTPSRLLSVRWLPSKQSQSRVGSCYTISATCSTAVGVAFMFVCPGIWTAACSTNTSMNLAFHIQPGAAAACLTSARRWGCVTCRIPPKPLQLNYSEETLEQCSSYSLLSDPPSKSLSLQLHSRMWPVLAADNWFHLPFPFCRRAALSAREGHTEALWMALDAMHRTMYLLSLKFFGTQCFPFPKAFRSINLLLERN